MPSEAIGVHIGYVLRKFPRLSDTSVLSEILELQRRGAEVTVFSLCRPHDGRFHRALADIARPVVYLGRRHGRGLADLLGESLAVVRECREALWRAVEPLIETADPETGDILGWAVELARAVRSLAIDHLHAHSAAASHVARAATALCHVPWSLTCVGEEISRRGVDRRAFRALARGAAFVVTVSEADRRHVTEQLEPESPVRTLYKGIDTAQFHPGSRVRGDTPLILGVGRLIQRKRFADLIGAVAALLDDGWDLRCSIVGDGDQRAELEARIASLSCDRVTLLGARTQDEVRALLDHASLLVLPSAIGEDGARDSLPTALLEAMACGVPTVVTPVGGTEEVVDHGAAGRLVRPRDPMALAAAIAQLLGDSAQLRAFSLAGRGRVERLFDLRKNIARLHDWFEEASGS